MMKPAEGSLEFAQGLAGGREGLRPHEDSMMLSEGAGSSVNFSEGGGDNGGAGASTMSGDPKTGVKFMMPDTSGMNDKQKLEAIKAAKVR